MVALKDHLRPMIGPSTSLVAGWRPLPLLRSRKPGYLVNLILRKLQQICWLDNVIRLDHTRLVLSDLGPWSHQYALTDPDSLRSDILLFPYSQHSSCPPWLYPIAQHVRNYQRVREVASGHQGSHQEGLLSQSYPGRPLQIYDDHKH